MGWGTWNLFGCFDCDQNHSWTEKDIRQIADTLVTSGLAKQGYKYVNLDGGWMGSRDPASGRPVASPVRFPSGMQALVDYVHAKGLLFGIYRDRREGFGHETADAQQFAEWKCDYIKNDGYGLHNNISSYDVYARFRDAVNATGRAMATNIKFDIQPSGFEGGPELANSWRVGRDIRPVWADVVRLADITSALGHLSAPGGFNDMDALEVGVPGRSVPQPQQPVAQPAVLHRTHRSCPRRQFRINGDHLTFCPGARKDCAFTGVDATMTEAEQRTHFALWAIAASPLILGNDLRTMSAATLAIVSAPGPIAVNQDPLGVGGRRIRLEPAGLYETWAKVCCTARERCAHLSH
jgi:alpha-galactosidase